MNAQNIRKAVTFIVAVLSYLGAAAQQHIAEPMGIDAVRLLPSRWRDNMQRDSAWLMSLPVESIVHSFQTTAGVYAGKEGGYMTVRKLGGWESLDCELRGHSVGHMMSALGLLYASTGEQIFKAKGDSIVTALKNVQECYGTGYLSAYPEELINRNMGGKSVWAPFYTMHKILSGLIDQYNLTGNRDALNIACGMMQWAWNKLKDVPNEQRMMMIRNEFGGINESFYNLYAITGDERAMKLARFFYHDNVIDPIRDKNPDLGTMHTNTFIPKIIAEARNYEINGDIRSRDAAEFFWDTMKEDHCFVTGCCSDKEHFFDPGKFHEHISGYTGETCCTYNMLKLTHHLFCWNADPKYADFYENALLNQILGQQDPQSGMVHYFQPMLSGSYKVYSTPWNSFWCCVGSGFENHARYGEAIYYQSSDTEKLPRLYINLFIASTLKWKKAGLEIRQDTQFPYGEKSEFTVKGNGKAEIAVRIPGWAQGATVKVNGRKTKLAISNGYHIISRAWKDGDRIELCYPMALSTVDAHGHPERFAIKYGPIVLGGELGTEGMKKPAPFSDPEKYNDYYTYNYNIPEGLNTGINPDLSLIKRHGDDLLWESEGRMISPLFDIHRQRYVVYWDRKDSLERTAVPEGFDCMTGAVGHRALLRLPRVEKEVKAVLFCHQNMTEEVLFRSPVFTSKMDSLGIAMVFVQQGSQNWDLGETDAEGLNCQQRFESIMKELARISSHPELADAKIIPFGHSAQATFPWNFAAWNPERTLCILSYHGDAPRTNLCGYGRANVEWGRTRNIDGIPGLMIEGEYEWWEARVNPALAFRMMYPDSRISFLCDAERGHFDLCEDTQLYIAKFIEKALSYKGGEGVLMSRWTSDGSECESRHDKFWYFDREMTDWTKRRYANSLGKKMQYVSVKINGEIVKYDPESHIKINLKAACDTLRFQPVFVDESRSVETDMHARTKPRVVLISGPAKEIAENTFVLLDDYFGTDPRRLWSGVTFCVEAEGDSQYKAAVQEFNVKR